VNEKILGTGMYVTVACSWGSRNRNEWLARNELKRAKILEGNREDN